MQFVPYKDPESNLSAREDPIKGGLIVSQQDGPVYIFQPFPAGDKNR